MQLVDPLEALGLAPLFDEGADLGGITDEGPLWVDDVLQKTWIRVDEQGTEAGAATAAMGAGMGGRPKPSVVKADHPFLYVIGEANSGAILFVGRVDDPSGA